MLRCSMRVHVRRVVQVVLLLLRILAGMCTARSSARRQGCRVEQYLLTHRCTVWWQLPAQLAYLVKTEVIDRKRFERDHELMTSVRWMTRKKPHPIYLLINKHHKRIPGGQFLVDHPFLILAGVQIAYTLLTIAPTAILYSSFEVHTAVLLGMVLISTWNGSNFYFEVFARNYASRIERRLAENQSQEIASSAAAAAAASAAAAAGDTESSSGGDGCSETTNRSANSSNKKQVVS
jgi:hypothetical protein